MEGKKHPGKEINISRGAAQGREKGLREKMGKKKVAKAENSWDAPALKHMEEQAAQGREKGEKWGRKR